MILNISYNKKLNILLVNIIYNKQLNIFLVNNN